eukprot:TRINITY_DN4563_c0_g1_i1.p1 TRINITY_DN4563_c0_g1~~TRINITY_DN4563_c0_g1_i1.p1  ORF type:complete len:219 (+),score=50.49 TRINITY_DN4563_c0_g1_i1:94-750(+)
MDQKMEAQLAWLTRHVEAHTEQISRLVARQATIDKALGDLRSFQSQFTDLASVVMAMDLNVRKLEPLNLQEVVPQVTGRVAALEQRLSQVVEAFNSATAADQDSHAEQQDDGADASSGSESADDDTASEIEADTAVSSSSADACATGITLSTESMPRPHTRAPGDDTEGDGACRGGKRAREDADADSSDSETDAGGCAWYSSSAQEQRKRPKTWSKVG